MNFYQNFFQVLDTSHLFNLKKMYLNSSSCCLTLNEVERHHFYQFDYKDVDIKLNVDQKKHF